MCYATGLAALHAALLLLNPRHVSVGEGYHGSHEVISVISRLSGLQKLGLDCPASDLEKGDVILLETPINPLGTAFSIEEYAKKAHDRGAYLIVDSTFGPPGSEVDGNGHGCCHSLISAEICSILMQVNGIDSLIITEQR